MSHDPQLSAEQRAAARICSRRRELGISQQALAELVGVTQPALSRWESGDNVPTLTNYRRLAQALDLPLSELIDPAHVVATGPVDERYVAEGA